MSLWRDLVYCRSFQRHHFGCACSHPITPPWFARKTRRRGCGALSCVLCHAVLNGGYIPSHSGTDWCFPLHRFVCFQTKKQEKNKCRACVVVIVVVGVDVFANRRKRWSGRRKRPDNTACGWCQGLLGRLQEHGRIPAAVPRRGHPCGKKVG